MNNLGDWGQVLGPFQFSSLFQLFDNQLRQDCSLSFFSKGEQETFKNGKCQLLNGHMMLYYHFIKIIKGSRTSFQSLILNQKHVRNVWHAAHQYWPNFILIVLSIQKKYACISVTYIMKQCLMASQILKTVYFRKTQKSNTGFYTSRATLLQKKVLQQRYL